MDLLSIIFHVGVILAVYNFLWWLIMLVIRLLRGGRTKTLFEVYFIKAIRYIFLCDVVFLFSIDLNGGELVANYVLIMGLILLFYFIGKIQTKQEKSSMFSLKTGQNMPGMQDLLKSLKPIFNLKLEIGVLVVSFLLYISFFFYPNLAYNNIAKWFLGNIQGIIDAPVFGFIFKMIGFFFLMTVVLKVVNSILALVTGTVVKKGIQQEEDDDDKFDDYTEV